MPFKLWFLNLTWSCVNHQTRTCHFGFTHDLESPWFSMHMWMGEPWCELGFCFPAWSKGLRTEGVVCCADCKAPWRKLWFVILGSINKIDLTWILQHMLQKPEERYIRFNTYFAVEPNCFRMLRDCRSMLAVESNQLLYLTSSVLLSPSRCPAPKTVHAGSRLCYFIRERRVASASAAVVFCMLMRVRVCFGRQFSFLFQEGALNQI